MTRLMPEPWERARMALAEVGGPAHAVYPSPDRRYTFTFGAELVDDPVLRWRAREAAMPHDPICYRCNREAWPLGWDLDARDARRRQCEAIRPFEQDCGVVL